MPYIEQKDRDKLDKYIQTVAGRIALSGNRKGDLNYAITRLAHLYLKGLGIKYDTLSDVHAVLSDVKAEFYRKVVAPYEDKKIAENGDIGVLDV